MSYATADHAVVSGINWMQMVRDGMFQNEKIESEIRSDLSALASMEEKLQRGKVEIDQNPDLSDQGRRRQISELAEKQMQPKIAHAENRIEGLSRGMKNVLKDISEYDIPATDSGDTRSAVREQEIRAYFKTADHGTIMQALRDAEENGDFETLRALELAPASIAVGPQDAIQQNRMARFRRKFPKEMQKYEDWERAKEIYESILRSLKKRFEAM